MTGLLLNQRSVLWCKAFRRFLLSYRGTNANCETLQMNTCYSSSVNNGANCSKNNNDIALYSVRVTGSCSRLYEMWHSRRLNRKKPLTGIDFHVVYADTMPLASPHVPVILCLHGSCGSHRHFDQLLTYFKRSPTPVRVILPNFPGWGFTQLDSNNMFGHSEEERAAFIHDFINVLDIKKIRVLVAHSTELYAALSLYQQSESIESFAFINPLGLRPLQMTKPVFLNRFLMRMIRLPFVPRLLLHLATNRVEMKAEHLVLMLKYILYVDYKKVKSRLLELALRRYPLFFAVSNDDSVMEADANQELIEMFALSDDSMSYHGKTTDRNCDSYPKGLIFDKGGHSLIETYPEILAKEILSLSAFVQRKPFVISSRNDAVYVGGN